MNARPVEAAAWSRRQWAAVVAFVMVAQVGLIFWFREPLPKARSPAKRFVVHLALTPRLEQRLAEWATVSDPTLFALPNENSFSGAAWLKFAPLQHRLMDWSEPPIWLTQKVDQLGKVFSQFVSTSAPPPYLIADQPLPGATAPEVVLPAASVATHSVLRIEPALAKRRLLSLVPLRTWPHPDLLTNSVVEVTVDEEGLVTSARLVAECGLDAADEEARGVARRMRFEPIRRRGTDTATPLTAQTTVGRLVFEWRTVPVHATNAPAIAP